MGFGTEDIREGVNMELTLGRLKELLDYDPDTGIFTWKVWRGGSAVAGSVAGNIDSHGHRQIKIDQIRYMAHRLAWLYFYGQLPNEEIDHINTIKNDNRINNLRMATHSQNMMHRGKNNNNTSGYKGVFWLKCASKWMAIIRVNRKRIYLGLFDSPFKAHEAYCEAAKLHHGVFFYE